MYKLCIKKSILNRNFVKSIQCCYKSDDLAAVYQCSVLEKDPNVSRNVSANRIYGRNIDNNQRCKRFSSLLPPPNVTGDLHLGHALMTTIQDVILRWKYSNGFDVLWIPGTDHAGISTQVVVEKKLRKERGVSRHDIGKEAFLEEVWKWKETTGDRIKSDLKRMGSAFDWDREYFTMDAAQSLAVGEAFIKLFERDLIYREKAPVNWSCALESAISDIEVENLEINGPTDVVVPGYDKRIRFGQITNIAYKICDAQEKDEIVVATTRPESILGDTAVAVNPNDNRFASLKDRNIYLWHPFRGERIPLVFDESIDPTVGTGAVKITPAHSKIDFAIAKRHSLPAKAIINEKGIICDKYGKFSGKQRFVARGEILNELANLGLLRETKDHTMQLPICSRSGDVIEHLLKPQWFVRTEKMAQSAIDAVENGEIEIHPASFKDEWHRWLSTNRDWCISRQLWWGHQVPAFECEFDGRTVWVASHDDEEARRKAAKIFNASSNSGIRVRQDDDVLDTWFSSGLLPFSTLGWPNETNDLSRYYPLDMLETGHDILLFWVAKMVMLGQELTGQAPFKSILLHGIIRDAQGRKMSKSKGNVILPHQIINGSTLVEFQSELRKSVASGVLSEAEYKKSLTNIQKSFPKGIPECGIDALRFTLCSHNISSHYIDFDVRKCHSNKVFLNKIWQATRFTLSNCAKLGINSTETPRMNESDLTDMDRWILSRLANTTIEFERAMHENKFHVATKALQSFIYSNFCDVYLEATKPHLFSGQEPFASNHCSVLLECLRVAMIHMSHFTPFLARELQKHLPTSDAEFLAEKWVNNKNESEMESILDICAAVRQVKSHNRITRKHEPEVYFFSNNEKTIESLQNHKMNIQKLTLTQDVHVNSDPEDGRSFVVESTAKHLCSFGISISAPLDRAVTEINQKKVEKLESLLQLLLTRSAPEGYKRNVSDDVQRRDAEKINQLKTEIAALKLLN